MAFCRTIIHVVQPGDTFYRLAQRYQTTVPEIILRNPGLIPIICRWEPALVSVTGKIKTRCREMR